LLWVQNSGRSELVRPTDDNIWYGCRCVGVSYCMICPSCNSTDLKKLSLIYAAGTYESHGQLHGLFLGSIGGLWVGRYRGTNQSSLSKMVAPPMKLPYASPTILWVVAFFILMALFGRGRLSTLMALVSLGYIFALPAYFLGALLYNFILRRRKYKKWEAQFLCQRCGTVLEAARSSRPDTQVPLNTGRRASKQLCGSRVANSFPYVATRSLTFLGEPSWTQT